MHIKEIPFRMKYFIFVLINLLNYFKLFQIYNLIVFKFDYSKNHNNKFDVFIYYNI